MELRTELLPYQLDAVDKLRRLKVGALFMEQGTGKSLTSLELARIRFDKGRIDHVIWLCPCSARQNIRREILKHCPDDMLNRFTICGIETLSTSVSAISYLYDLAGKKRCMLIVDESLLIKNFMAKRTQNILRIAERCPYRLILNGTPVSRNEADLFAQMYLLDWRILGYKSYYSFAANHLEYDDCGRIRRVLDVGTLTDKISPYVYQVRRADCMQLPEKVYDSNCFSLTDDQQELYDYVADRLLLQVDEMRPETIYRLFSGLRAVISGKRLVFTNDSHFEAEEFFSNPMDNPRVQYLIDALPRDDKCIVFCEYESEISQLCGILGSKAVRFDGKVSLRNRDNNLKAFQSEAQYLIANKQCAGYSLNLQFCHRIIYMSNDWDLGTRLQSEDRVHRLGQTDQVTITDILCRDTIDMTMADCIARKENMLDAIKCNISNRAALADIIHGKSVRTTEKDNLDGVDAA